MDSQPTPRRRRTSTETWSASSTVTYHTPTGQRTTDPTRAAKATVRWRHGTHQPRQTFTGPNAATTAHAFQTLLTAAHANNWPADHTGRPIPTIATEPDPQPDTPRLLPPPIERHLPAPPVTAECVTVGDLISWYRTHLSAGNSRITGERRAGKTLDQYDAELNFIAATLTYPHGDPRLDHLTRHSIHPGDPLLLDGPNGIDEHDLRRLISEREHTNLRTRHANERALTTWNQTCAAELGAASKANRAANLPPPPDLKPEHASPRTVASLYRTAQHLFTTAYKHRRTATNLWTLPDDEQPRTRKPMITIAQMHNPQQVRAIADAVASTRRGGNTGERYHAYIIVEGTLAPRPGALRALRRSRIRLDADTPHIIWAEAFVESTIGNSPTGQRRRTGPTKARHATVERYQPIPTHLIPILEHHLDRYVDEPTPENPDPLVFTTATGAPIDNDNFREDWWNPAVAAVIDDAARQHPFRTLRRTGITDMLMAGHPIKHVSDWVGARQTTIEDNYAAILTVREIGATWPTWKHHET